MIPEPARRIGPSGRCARWMGKLVFGLAVTLVVNGFGLLLLNRLNARAVAVPAVDERPVAIVDFTAPPPKPRREQRPEPPRPRRDAPTQRRLTPVPNAPSRIAADRLEAPALDVAGLIDGAALEGALSRDMRLVFQEEEVDEPPRLIHRVSPTYPQAAADRGIAGEVQFRALVGTDGRVTRLEIVAADPPGVFEAATRAAVTRWRFRPAVFEGRTVSVWTRSRLVFRLE